jgi:hypothetical protein
VGRVGSGVFISTMIDARSQPTRARRVALARPQVERRREAVAGGRRHPAVGVDVVDQPTGEVALLAKPDATSAARPVAPRVDDDVVVAARGRPAVVPRRLRVAADGQVGRPALEMVVVEVRVRAAEVVQATALPVGVVQAEVAPRRTRRRWRMPSQATRP